MITANDVREMMEKMAEDYGQSEFDSFRRSMQNRTETDAFDFSTPKPKPVAPKRVKTEPVAPKRVKTEADHISKERNSVSGKNNRVSDRISGWLNPLAQKAVSVVTPEQRRIISGGRPLREDEYTDVLSGKPAAPQWVTKVRDIGYNQQKSEKVYSQAAVDDRKKTWASERDREMRGVMPRYGKHLEQAKVDSQAEMLRRLYPGADEKRIMESAKATAPDLAINDEILLEEGAYHKELDSGKGRNVPQLEKIKDEEVQNQRTRDFWNNLKNKNTLVHQMAGVSTMGVPQRNRWSYGLFR
jgi:hypothetical protein